MRTKFNKNNKTENPVETGLKPVSTKRETRLFKPMKILLLLLKFSILFITIAAVTTSINRLHKPQHIITSELPRLPTDEPADRPQITDKSPLRIHWDTWSAKRYPQPRIRDNSIPAKDTSATSGETPMMRTLGIMDFGADISLASSVSDEWYSDIWTDNTNGYVHVVYSIDGTGIYYRRSTNGGVSFDAAIGIGSSFCYNARVASRGSYVWIVAYFDNGSEYDIVYWRSTNGGVSFDAGVIIAHWAGEYCVMPDVTVDESGYAYIYYTNVIMVGGGCDPADIGSGNILYCYTTNNGASWEGHYYVTDNGDGGNYPKIAFIAPNSETVAGQADIHMSICYDWDGGWLSDNTQNFDIYYRRVNNASQAHTAGMTLGPFTQIYFNPGASDAYAWWNSIDAENNTVYLSYIYNNSDATYTKSTNNGDNWTAWGSNWTSADMITIACDEDENPIATLAYSIGNVETGSSDDGGTTWNTLRRVNDTANRAYQSVHSMYHDTQKRRADVAWAHDYWGDMSDMDVYYDKCLQWRCRITLTGITGHPVTTTTRDEWGQNINLTFSTDGTYTIYVDDGGRLEFPATTNDLVNSTTDTRIWDPVSSQIVATINYTGGCGGTVPVGTWHGCVSTDWNNANNWGGSTEPDNTIDVIIPTAPEGGNWPHITTSTEYCKDLTIQTGATLYLDNGGYLRVHGNLDSDEGTFTQSGTSYLYFDGSTNTWWDDDNTDDTYINVRVDKDINTAQLTMWQDMTVATSFEIREGIFAIDATWTLTVNGTAADAFEVESGGQLKLTDETVDCAGGVQFESGSSEDVTGGTIKCEGSFDVDAGGDFTPTGGLVEMDGTTQNIYNGGTLYFYGLRVKDGSATTSQNSYDAHYIQVWDNSHFYVNGYTIDVDTDINPAGAAATNGIFEIDGGTVNCQFVSGYGIVRINTSGVLNVTGSSAGIAIGMYEANDELELTSGTINVNTTTSDVKRIYIGNGAIFDMDAGTCNLIPSSPLTDDYNYTLQIDAGGTVDMSGGTVNISNNSTGWWWDMYVDGTLNMSGGTLNIDDGLTVDNGTVNHSNGTIRTGYDSSNRAWSLYVMAGGIFNMTGGSAEFRCGGHMDCDNGGTTNLSLGTFVMADLDNVLVTYIYYGGPFRDLEIDRISGRVVELSESIILNGDVIITSGTFDVSGNNYSIDIAGDWYNDDTFTRRIGVVTFNGTGDQSINGTAQTDFYNLYLNKTSGKVNLNQNIGVANIQDMAAPTESTMDLIPLVTPYTIDFTP